MSISTDVVIIGAGPVGLFSIFQCGMLGLKTHVIDILPEIGGQCTALYPEKPIYDIPAHPKILAKDLVEQLKKQADPFKPIYHLNQSVTDFTHQKDYWIVKTNQNTLIKTKAILIAAGGGLFGPNRPPLKDIELYENYSVFYAVREKEIFRNKNIMIAGGGDSAIDWAIELSSIAKKIYLIHRRSKFRAAPEMVNQLYALEKQNKISILTPYQLHSLQGEGKQLSSVSIINFEQKVEHISVDALLAFYGLSMNITIVQEWGVHLDNNLIKIDPVDGSTSLPGIYAIGDIATYAKKLKLILCGFSEAAMAAHGIYRYIYPDKILHFQYSTTQGVPS